MSTKALEMKKTEEVKQPREACSENKRTAIQMNAKQKHI